MGIGHPQHLAISFSLAFLAIAGCMTTPNRPFLGLSSLSVSEAKLERAGDQTDLKVSLDFGRRAQTVPGTWTRAVITLSNTSLLPSPLSRDITQSSGTTITASAATFLNLRPGSGYSVSITLYNGTTQVASGTNSSVTLAAGANTINVALTLTATPTPTPVPGPTAMPAGQSVVFAGGGASAPDNVLATSANLVTPNGVAVDATGSVYITSYDAIGGVYMVPAVSGTYFGRSMTAGKIYTLAGGGATVLNATTRSAAPTTVALHVTAGVAVDAAGNLFFCDRGDNTYDSGVYVLPARNTTLFGLSMTANTLYAVAGQILGTLPNLAESPGLTSSGDLLVPDSGNQDVYILPNATRTQYGASLTRGTGQNLPLGWTHGVYQPQGIAVDASDNLYVAAEAQTGNVSGATDRVWKLTPTGTWSTPYTYSTIHSIYSAACDTLGNLAVGNFASSIPISLAPVSAGSYYGSTLSTGTGQQILGSLNFAAYDVGNMAFDSARNLFIPNFNQGKVYKVGP